MCINYYNFPENTVYLSVACFVFIIMGLISYLKHRSIKEKLEMAKSQMHHLDKTNKVNRELSDATIAYMAKNEELINNLIDKIIEKHKEDK